jgi:hypothetical protein
MGVICTFSEVSSESLDYYLKHGAWKKVDDPEPDHHSPAYYRRFHLSNYCIEKGHATMNYIFCGAYGYYSSPKFPDNFIYSGTPLRPDRDDDEDDDDDENEELMTDRHTYYYNVEKTKTIAQFLQSFIKNKRINEVDIVELCREIYLDKTLDPVTDREYIEQIRFEAEVSVMRLQRFFNRVVEHKNCVLNKLL